MEKVIQKGSNLVPFKFMIRTHLYLYVGALVCLCASVECGCAFIDFSFQALGTAEPFRGAPLEYFHMDF